LYNSIGLFYANAHEYDSALHYYSKFRQTLAPRDSVFGEGAFYLNTALVFIYQKQFDSAEVYVKKSIPYIVKEERPDVLRNAYRHLSQATAGQGKYKLAYRSYKRYKKLEDSLAQVREIKAAAQVEAQLEKREARLEAQQQRARAAELELQASRRANWLLAVGTGLFVVLAAGGGLYYRRRRDAQEARREAAEARRLRQAAEAQAEQLEEADMEKRQVLQNILGEVDRALDFEEVRRSVWRELKQVDELRAALYPREREEELFYDRLLAYLRARNLKMTKRQQEYLVVMATVARDFADKERNERQAEALRISVQALKNTKGRLARQLGLEGTADLERFLAGL
jgi:hypothetical protein